MNNKTKFLVKVGVFSAIAFILQLIGSLMSLKVAGFLEVEFSDLPAIVMAFALGPVAGVLTELIKNVLHLTISSTGFVGEFANFVITAPFVAVCGLIYRRKRTKKTAAVSLILGTIVFAIFGILANIFIMLPLYMPDWDLAQRLDLAFYTILPFNIIKGAVLSVITLLIYKKISGLIK